MGEPCAVDAACTVREKGRRKRTRAKGTSPAAYLTLNVHKDARLREFIDFHDWITCHFLPAYEPDLNRVEGIWSLLRQSSQAILPSPTLTT